MEEKVSWIQLSHVNKEPKVRIAKESVKRMKKKIREITSRKKPISDGVSNKETKPIPYGMVWIFCIGRYAKCISKIGFMDSKKTANVYMETMEETKNQSEKTHWIRYSERTKHMNGEIHEKATGESPVVQYLHRALG